MLFVLLVECFIFNALAVRFGACGGACNSEKGKFILTAEIYDPIQPNFEDVNILNTQEQTTNNHNSKKYLFNVQGVQTIAQRQTPLRIGVNFMANFWNLLLHRQTGENFIFDGVRAGNIDKIQRAIRNGDNVLKIDNI